MKKNALKFINKEIDSNFFDKDTNVFIVLWMPTSDIWKWTIVSHMLSMLEESDAIKFDWLLNTNKNWRHTAEWWDDFWLYSKYNKDKKFWDEKYILWWYLYKDFIEKYWEYENLSFRPHMWKHFIATFTKMYRRIWKPKNLILEIGWTIIDYEVDSYIPPAIYYLKKRLWNKCKIILLTTTDRNWHYIKTRIVQRAVKTLSERFIYPDIILCREPSYIPKTTINEKISNENTIKEKIYDRLWVDINKKNIITIPYYLPEDIDKLWIYLKERMSWLLKPKKIFLWTNNLGKIKDYKNFIKNFDIITPIDINKKCKIIENSYSLIENSQKKALERSKISWLATLSEDTWFFVNSLNWKPWVSIKTRWWELKTKLSEEDFLWFIKEKFLSLDDKTCYFYTVLSLAFPDWEVVSIAEKVDWYIDVNKFGNIPIWWYPLSAIFVAHWRWKTRVELNNDEKKNSMKEFMNKINLLLKRYYDKI